MSRKKKQPKTLEALLEEALVPEEEQPYEVPENWVWVRLGSVVTFFSGAAFPNKHQGKKGLPIPFFKVGNLKSSDSNGHLLYSENTIDDELRKKLKAKMIPKGSILFAKIGEAIKLNRRSINLTDCCIDNNLMAFKNIEELVLSHYLYHWSKVTDFYQFAQATAVPSIRKSTLESLPFPLPPLPEQKRIVDRVESLLGKIDEAKGLIQEAWSSFEQRRAAILDQAFRGELTRTWREQHPDAESADRLRNGSGKRRQAWRPRSEVAKRRLISLPSTHPTNCRRGGSG